MARKVLNRRELRRANDSAPTPDQAAGEGAEVEAAATGAAVKKKKAAAPKKKSRSAAAKEVRLKAFWGVFNQSLRRVALFEYSEKPAATAKAEELSVSTKTPHFVQPVKEPIKDVD